MKARSISWLRRKWTASSNSTSPQRDACKTLEPPPKWAPPLFLGLILLAFVLAIGCSTKDSGGTGKSTSETGQSTPHEHAEEPHHEELPRRVKLDPQVVLAAKIKTEPVRREALTATLSLPGEIVADPDKVAHVSALVDGRVERVMFQEGATVKKGDALVVVRVPEIGKARGALAATRARAKAARSNVQRLRHLVKQKLAAEQEQENAEAEASALEAEAAAISAELSAMGSGPGAGAAVTLRAPMTGVVVARSAVVGQPVTGQSVLATVADLSQVWFLGRVFERHLGALREGANVEVELNAYSQERFDGTLEYVGQQIDPVARTLTGRVRLTNRDGKLRLGLFGMARIALGTGEKRPEMLVISRTALLEIGGKSVVFVREPEGDFALHEVVLGEASVGKVGVLSGLSEGEQVVVEGSFTLKSVVLKSAFAEEE